MLSLPKDFTRMLHYLNKRDVLLYEPFLSSQNTN